MELVGRETLILTKQRSAGATGSFRTVRQSHNHGHDPNNGMNVCENGTQPILQLTRQIQRQLLQDLLTYCIGPLNLPIYWNLRPGRSHQPLARNVWHAG